VIFPSRLLRLRHALLLCAGVLLPVVPGQNATAQISLPSAVNLTLKNSPKVKVAQAETARAQAVLQQSKEAFVPAVSANGGVGKSTGAPLGPPVVFSISAQSLVYNSSQADYIRAARAGLEAAQLSLDAARSDAVEDATSTYIALDNALQRRAAAAQALDVVHRLVAITEDRFTAGVDPHIELTRARHTEAQIRLQKLLIEDEIAEQSGHLARLTGLSASGLTTDPASIPALQLPSPDAPPPSEDPRRMIGVSAGFAAARAKQFTAHGEKHYLLRPQIGFTANYSRISTAFTTYTEYYPYFAHPGNSFNSLNLGVEVTVPILDMVHRAKYRETLADAAKSLADAEAQQMLFLDGRDKLRRSAAELAARRDLAGFDRDLAQDQLDTVLLRLQANAGASQGEQLTPKDEQNARLQEQLRTIDMLTADLQLQQTMVTLMRQEGSLTNWLAATVPGATAAPAAASPALSVPVPATVGVPPGGAAPAGITAPAVPTVGTPPSTAPAGPVTSPAPAAPPSAPSTTPSGPPHS